MLWRVRTTLPDRPGSLASLAQECGRAGVNILALQLFPGVDRVTDELVLRVPVEWHEPEVRELLERAGGESVVAAPCTEAALVDQPTRYVLAAHEILRRPASFPEVVAHLFDADADAGADAGAGAASWSDAGPDVMDLVVGDVAVQVRRAAPFTGVEHARGAALADLVGDVLGRVGGAHAARVASPARRLGAGSTPTYAVGADEVVASIDGVAVGRARVGAGTAEEPRLRTVELDVDPAWQRRGIGTRLLSESARLAVGLDATEIVLTTRADNQAVLPMVLAAGLRGRIRMAGDVLTVRIGLQDVRRPRALVD